MASSRIKGITVEIGGDTTGLQKALKNVNSEISNTNSQLKDVNRLLKIDPGNTELLTQKQKYLADAVNATKEKLKALKEAQEQVAGTAENYDAWKAAYDPIQAEIEKTNEKLKDLKTKAKEAQEQLSKGEISQEQYDKIQDEITNTKDALEKLKDKAKEVSEEFGNPVSADQYNGLKREIEDTEQKLKDLETQASQSGTAIQQIAAAGDTLESTGKKTTSVGKSLLPISTAVSVVGVKALKTASNFDTAMSQVQAITGAAGDEFESLRTLAEDLGASTSFSATEVAESMTEMAKAGWSSQQIMDGMSGVLDAAAASGEEVSSVATIIADALTGFELDASSSENVADLLTQAANSGTIDISDLGESFKYVSSLGSSMGFSISDVTTALAAMSTAGIKGSQAGTALRTAFLNMASPTDEVAAAMKEIGLSVTNADGTFKDMDTILAEMRVGMAGMTDAEKENVVATIAGKNAVSGLMSIMNMTQDEYDTIAESMDNCSGVAQQTASVMQDNFGSKVEQLTGALETLAIELSEQVMPTLTEMVKKITALVDKFSGLDPVMQKVIVVIGAIVAVAGPLLIFVGKIITAVLQAWER